MMNDGDRDTWGAYERAWRVASQNLQLLGMLEVLDYRTASDIESLTAHARMTLAFPTQVVAAEAELPIDPGGRVRATLVAAHDKAVELQQLAMRTGRAQPVTPRDLLLASQALRGLADACEDLCEWIGAHDRAFEKPDPTGPVPLEAA